MRIELSVHLADDVVEALFAANTPELPESYHTNQSIQAAIKRQKLKARLLKHEAITDRNYYPLPK